VDNPAEPPPRIDAVFGLLWRSDQPCLSIEDINKAAADGWAGVTMDDTDAAVA